MKRLIINNRIFLDLLFEITIHGKQKVKLEKLAHIYSLDVVFFHMWAYKVCKKYE